MGSCAENYRITLNMEPHPEGGYFKEIYAESSGQYSSILFLLCLDDVSHFHRLQEDEIWYHHDGDPLDIYEISPEGKLSVITLGKNVNDGEKLQYMVPKGSVFGAKLEKGSFALVSCMVSPAFTYEHFEILKRSSLLVQYPQYALEIEMLTAPD